MIHLKKYALLIRITFLSTLFNFLFFSETLSNPVPGGTQRYVGLVLLNLSQDGVVEKRLIEEAHSYGMNSVYLTIPWDMVYWDSPTAPPNWARYDEQIALAVSKGMSVAIRIQVSRNKLRLNGFWNWANDGLKDHERISHMGAYQSSTFRYNYMPAVNKAADFVNELVRRYAWVQNQNKLLFVSVTNTPEQEAGYPFQNFEPETDHPRIYRTNFDCSSQSFQEFKTWTSERYGKIRRLNSAWGTNYDSFSQVEPRIAFWEAMETYQFRRGKDWYRFQHEILKKYTDVLVNAVKSVNPNIRYVSDYGSVHDRICNVRGTVLFGALNENSDGVKVNDAPDFDHRYTMDVVRGGLRPGAFIANEVFLTEDNPISDIVSQVNGNFRHGAHFVGFVSSSLSSLSRVRPQIVDAVATWQGSPRPTYEDALGPVVYSSSKSIDDGIHTHSFGAWRDIALADPHNSRPTRVIPDNDIFSDAYWAVAANIPPTVVRSITMPEGVSGVPFEYTVPANSFTDSDGSIVRLELANLPTGLTFNGSKIVGTPIASGTFEINITAVDDENGKVTTKASLVIIPGTLEVKYHEPLKARAMEGAVSLTWGTEQEENSSHFDVQRSTDGLSFTTIGQISARENASTHYTYQWMDVAPLAGINYYRLKATDLDGTFTYTAIVSAQIAAATVENAIYPNPASDQFSILKENAVRLELLRLTGEKVQEVSSDRMVIKDVTGGLYVVKVEYADGRTESHRLVIE
jgi:hypothetical protein